MVKRYRRGRGARRAGLRKRMRRGKVQRIPRALSGVHRFKEVTQTATIAAGAGVSQAGIATFNLNELTNATSFKNLFDLYKITGVKLKIVPQFNVSQFPVAAATPAGPELLPLLYIAENRDPFVPAPVGVLDILSDDGVKIIRMSRPVNMYLKNPKALIEDTSPDGLTLVQNAWQFNSSATYLQPWLPTGGNGQTKDLSNAKHYGYRWYLDNSQSTVAVTLLCYATYYFQMKEAD